MTLEINKEKLSIMGVQCDNDEDFNTVWYAIGSSMIEGYKPSTEDILELKEYTTNKRKELNIG